MTPWIVRSRLTFRLLVAFICVGLSSGVVLAQDKKLEAFDPKSFDGRSISIDNEWFPLKPGSKWHYRGLEGHTHMVDKVRVTPKRSSGSVSRRYVARKWRSGHVVTAYPSVRHE